MIHVLFSKQELDEETYQAYQNRLRSIIFTKDDQVRNSRLFTMADDICEVFEDSEYRRSLLNSCTFLQGRSNDDLQMIRDQFVA